jgi:hypothetical protein
MTQPQIVFARLALGLGAGILLGICHGFLRPLRHRCPFTAEALFFLAMAWGWLILGFGVWQGDLRLGYFVPYFGGWLLWEITLGRLVRPLFSGFWAAVEAIFRIFLWPVKKIFYFAKILFASVEKWVTIKWNYRRHMRRRPGGMSHEGADQNHRQCAVRLSTQLRVAEDRGDCTYRVFYGCADFPELGASEHPGKNRGYAPAGPGTAAAE